MFCMRNLFYYVLVILISLYLPAIVLSDTTHNGHTITAGTTENWSSAGNNHIVTGNIYVEGTLNINQSCYIKFYNSCKIEVRNG